MQQAKRALVRKCLDPGGGMVQRPADPPQQSEKKVCSKSEACKGCPFPASGFICWGEDGDCMRTRIDKLKENKTHDSTED